MNIDKYDVITLDDKDEYLVVSKVDYENKNYLYLANVNDNQDIKLCVEEVSNGNVSVVDVVDDILLNKLVFLFAEDVKDILEQE